MCGASCSNPEGTCVFRIKFSLLRSQMPYVDIWGSGPSDNKGTCIAVQIRIMCVSIGTDTILLNIKDT